MEIIVALVIVGLIALGLVRVSTVSVKSSRFSNDQSKATTIAQAKLAQMVNMRNNEADSFWDLRYSGTASETTEDGYCLLTTIVDKSTDPTGLPIPTESPLYNKALLALVKVDIFWGEKQAGVVCSNDKEEAVANYEHTLHFETYVSN